MRPFAGCGTTEPGGPIVWPAERWNGNTTRTRQVHTGQTFRQTLSSAADFQLVAFGSLGDELVLRYAGDLVPAIDNVAAWVKTPLEARPS